jgi:hypothetical protein
MNVGDVLLRLTVVSQAATPVNLGLGQGLGVLPFQISRGIRGIRDLPRTKREPASWAVARKTATARRGDRQASWIFDTGVARSIQPGAIRPLVKGASMHLYAWLASVLAFEVSSTVTALHRATGRLGGCRRSCSGPLAGADRFLYGGCDGIESSSACSGSAMRRATDCRDLVPRRRWAAQVRPG